MMKSRSVFPWIALGACGAVAVAVVAVKERRAPALPAVVHYTALPALFDGALVAARARVVDGGYVSDDIRALARLYQANRLHGEAHACYAILRDRDGGLTAKDRYYLADIAQYQGDLDAAEAELRAVIQSDPGYLPAHLALGDVLFKSGRPDAARVADLETLALTPNQPQAMFRLARLDLIQGDDGAAIARLGALIQAHPDMTSGAALLAQIFDRRGDAARADAMRQWSRQKPEPVPRDPWLDALLKDCYDVQRLALKFEEYATSGDFDLAVPLLKRVEELDPASPIPQLLRGWSQARDHNDAEAVRQYRLALDKGGDPEKICPYMVQSLMALGRVADAATLLKEFRARKPDSIPILIAYSQVAMRQGDEALARTLLERVVAREPYLASANMSLARILWSAGDREAAAKCLVRVVQVSADDVGSRALLGEYYIGKGDPQSAIPALEQALALEHTASPVGKNLVSMLLAAYVGTAGAQEEKGQLAAAVGLYDKAIALEPSSPIGYARKAAVCARLGQFALASDALGRLASLQPGNPTIYLSLGDVDYQGGDREKAKRDWQQALDLTRPGDADLRGALAARLDQPITEETFK